MTAFDPSRLDDEAAIQQHTNCPRVKWHTTFDVTSRICDVRCPVLELQGESMPGTDALFETWLQQYRVGYPPAWTVQRIMGGAHYFLVEQPQRTAEALSLFWKAAWGRPRLETSSLEERMSLFA